MTAKLNGIEMGCGADTEYADQLVLAAIKTPLAGVGLHPNDEVQHRIVNGCAGRHQFTHVAPILANEVHGAIDRNTVGVCEGIRKKACEGTRGHLAGCHCELTMFHSAAATNVTHTHIVGWI